ncbi:effector binding domain-containing protein [Streptococcus salivarius]|uniref:effector binding domain-containing protein n=1 Tax=Streptococcus salivarius TaxID=1304 RepID=UPI001604E565|nr:effector binding domain-containing protein [Streptococcus salivarius]MDU2962915.1 hypothetical protein [Streptococcus salivarius]
MSDFQTMDDFAVFVNDYLTPDRLKVQAYSYASDQQELSLLVTIDDYEMMCRWHAVWTFSGLHQAFFQSVMDLDNSFSIDSDSLAMKVRLRDQELLFQAKGLEMVVVDLPEPLFRLADVSFNEGGKHFTYLCEDLSVTAEDWVLVPIGFGNAEKEAFVERISYVLADEVPVELTKLKKVIQKLDLVTVRYDVKVVRKGFLSFSGMAFDGEELGKPTDFLWVPFLAEQDDLAVPTYGIRINDGSRKTYVTALAGEDDSMEMIALAPATYAVFKLRGPATAAVWESFHYAKKHFEMIDQPTVEVYPPGNRQAEDYEMEVWIPIKEEV